MMEFPAALVDAFWRTTGLRILAVQDKDGAVWWADVEGGKPEVFRCSIGDRSLHIDELADGTKISNFELRKTNGQE